MGKFKKVSSRFFKVWSIAFQKAGDNWLIFTRWLLRILLLPRRIFRRTIKPVISQPVISVKPINPMYVDKRNQAYKQKIDEQILTLERSTRVTFKQLCVLHNYLRQKYAWYYKWHVYKYSNQIHLTVLWFFMAATVAFVSGALFFTHVPKSLASNATASINGTANIPNTAGSVYFDDGSFSSNVTIDNYTRQLNGYAWSPDVGWIDFGGGSDNSQGPVSVDPTGHLSGIAKVLNGGSINFNSSPYGSNVTINNSNFSGYAWDDDLGWINFSGVTSNSYTPLLNIAPTNSATNVSPTPVFQFSTPLGTSQFKIKLDTVNTFNSGNLQTIDETQSQTGWSGQNASGNTAYGSGTTATYTSTVPLMQNTVYYWRVDTYQGGTFLESSNTWSFTVKPVGKIVFTTNPQSLVAGTSGQMTVQLETAQNEPVAASFTTALNLSSNAITGRFDSSAGGQFNGSVTTASIATGSLLTSFYYKDTLTGTPTLTVAESPSQGWSDPTQQETITPAAANFFTLSQYPKASSGQWAVSSTPWDDTTGAGPAAPYNPLVVVKDVYGNTVTNFTGSVWFGVGTDYSSNFTYFDQPDSYTFTTGPGGDNGSHQFDGSDFVVETSGTSVPFLVETAGFSTTFQLLVKPAILGQLTVSFGQDTGTIGQSLPSPSNDVTVTAYDVVGNVKTDYTGSLYFTSSDPSAVLPYTQSSPYVFQPSDNGVKTFPGTGFTFNTAGNQTLTAIDIDTAISSSPASITISAHPPTNVQATAGDGTITLSWVNTTDLPVNAVHIYQSTTSGQLGTELTHIPTANAGQAGSFTVTGLTNGTTYYYTLRSVIPGPSDNPIIESVNSVQVSAIPAPIAPKNITAVQNQDGTVTIFYSLRFDSDVSLNYFNPNTNTWSQANALTGDIGSQAGDINLVSHIITWTPSTDFPGQFFSATAGFKIEVQVVVSSETGDGISDSFRLDTRPPSNVTLVANSRNGTTANLSISATDDSTPLQMELCTDSQFTGCSYQSFATSVSNFPIGSATAIYLRVEDNFSNTTTVTDTLPGAVQNFELADASTMATSNFRLLLDWSPFPGASSYILERSTDGTNFTNLATITNATSYVDAGLIKDSVYYYQIEEEDAAGNISRPSIILSAKPGAVPNVTNDPIVQLFDWRQNVGIQAQISWQTDQETNSFVVYSTEPLAAGTATTTQSGAAALMVGVPDQTMNHIVTISDLNPSTTYYLKALSQNDINVIGASSVITFTTPAVVILSVSGMQTANLTLNSVDLNWTTNKIATTVLEYGTTTDYGQTITDDNFNTNHTAHLAGLDNGTTYHFRVVATDQDGNVTDSDDYILSTPPKPAISNITVTGQTNDSVVVNWTTNVNTNTNVEFGPTNSYGSQQGKPDATTIHSLTVVGLDARTSYHFQVTSTDQYNNTVSSGDSTFTTTFRSTPPVISNVNSEISIIGDISSSNYQIQDVVSWTTDEPASSQVKYGQGVVGNYDQSSPTQDNLDIDHVVILTSLKANTSYSFQIVSKDASGNVATSTNYTILTPAKQQSLTTIIVNTLTSNFAWVGVLKHRWF